MVTTSSPRPLGAALLMAGLLAGLWVLEFFDQLSGERLDNFGIHAQELDGLPEIFTAPFLHAGWDHLISNSVPFFVLGFLVLLGGMARWALSSLISIVASGLTAWLLTPAEHDHRRSERPDLRLARVPAGPRDVVAPPRSGGARRGDPAGLRRVDLGGAPRQCRGQLAGPSRRGRGRGVRRLAASPARHEPSSGRAQLLLILSSALLGNLLRRVRGLGGELDLQLPQLGSGGGQPFRVVERAVGEEPFQVTGQLRGAGKSEGAGGADQLMRELGGRPCAGPRPADRRRRPRARRPVVRPGSDSRRAHDDRSTGMPRAPGRPDRRPPASSSPPSTIPATAPCRPIVSSDRRASGSPRRAPVPAIPRRPRAASSR